MHVYLRTEKGWRYYGWVGKRTGLGQFGRLLSKASVMLVDDSEESEARLKREFETGLLSFDPGPMFRGSVS